MSESVPEPECVIVADSEVIIRYVLSDYLRHCGYKVIDAASSDEVIALVENAAVKVTVILSDVLLKGSMNAFALRLRMRQSRPDIDFVLAGNVDAAAHAAGELCDEGPHLKRPYDPQAVTAHIRQLLAAAQK